MTGLFGPGTWVEIHSIVLPAGERAPQVPDDTRRLPLEMRVKGCLVAPAALGGQAEILTPAERLRLSAVYVSSFRRLESVYVQHSLGTMEQENKQGFEKSMIPLLQFPFGREWWSEAKVAFYAPFVHHIDEGLAGGKFERKTPSIQLPPSAD